MSFSDISTVDDEENTLPRNVEIRISITTDAALYPRKTESSKSRVLEKGVVCRILMRRRESVRVTYKFTYR
jgi:hypothetical protein